MYSGIFLLYSDIFSHIPVVRRHIQPHCDIIRTLCNTCMFTALLYSEYWHIQNPRYIQNSVKVFSGIFRTLCNAWILRNLQYSELCHVHNFGIFRTQGTFRILFICAYSGIFNNNSSNDINFLFFTLIFYFFKRNLKRHVF